MRTYVFDAEANDLLDGVTKVWCGCFSTLDGKDKRDFLPHQIKEMLSFLDTVDILIGHNIIGYDLPVLKKLYGYEFKGTKIDTLLVSRLLNPKRFLPPHCPDKKTGPHSLKAWGYRLGLGKVEYEDWSQFSPEMLNRCQVDVKLTILVYYALEKEKANYEWDPALKLTHRLFEILQKQEEYGWLVDRDWMMKSIHMLDHWMRRIDNALDSRLPLTIEIEEDKIKGVYKYVKEPFKINGQYASRIIDWMVSVGMDPLHRCVVGPYSRVSFRRISLNKPSEIKDFLLEQGWEPLEWNTDDDGVRTSPKLDKNDPFDGIESRMGQLVARYIQCKSRKAILEGWVSIIRPDGRIPSVVANLAETGRMTHRNIVNVPNGEAFFGKWMRKIFIAKKGWKLVGTDSAGCQIRMLAGRMNDPAYTETILNGDKDKGTDIHSVNMRAAGLTSRGKAKNFFYGFLFGAGDAKTGKLVNGNASDGKRLKEQFLKGLPALGALMETLTSEWRSNAKTRSSKWGKGVEYYDGWFKGLDGRPIFCKSEHAVLVYCLQSDEGIMMTCAYCWTYKELTAKYKWGEDFGIVGIFHDEINVECRADIAEDVGRIVEECIVKAGKYYKINCPHAGEAAIGDNWYQVH